MRAGTHDLLGPVAAGLGLSPGRAKFEFEAYHFVFLAKPLPDFGPRPEEALTFVACVSNERLLRANLLASPDLGEGTIHEVILLKDCPSAASGLNTGISNARNRIVVGVHQDVYLPHGWCRRFLSQWREAESRFGPVGVACVYGTTGRGDRARRTGHVVDRINCLREKIPLPAPVDSADELLLAVGRDSGLRFDPDLGFHLYGTDICLRASRSGLASIALDAPCLHNSLGEGLPRAFSESVRVLAAKWPELLPITTPCVQIGTDETFREWW